MSKVGSSVGGIAKCNAEMHSIENGFSLPMWNLVARWGCRGITNTLRLSIAINATNLQILYIYLR